MSFFNRLRRLIESVGMPQISTICSREEFSCILKRELARAERTDQIFSVVDFDIGDVEVNSELGKLLLRVLSKRLRSTDEVGWLDNYHIGVLLYNTPFEGAEIFSKTILGLLPAGLPPPEYKIHTYPAEKPKDVSTYQRSERKKSLRIFSYSRDTSKLEGTKAFGQMKTLYFLAMPKWKRLLDIVGALFLLILFSPLFVLAALMIRSVSSGPVFFRQVRVGYGGQVFTLYKFRTMKVNADSSAHRKHLSELIRGGFGDKERGTPMVKLDDPQVIPLFGRIMRATCIDELPQLINVFLGDMSLVGPRPPIPYEVEEYASWYRGRFDAVPGMTGLWQVSGKNRLTFKDMARLDIRYARQMSFALDLKILLSTPLAIFYEIKDRRRKKQSLAKGVDSA